MKRPAVKRRGPSTSPALIASRNPTSMNQVPPGMEMLVTPERSTVCALRAARMALNPGLMVPRPLGYLVDETAGKPKDRWQWPSISPGIIHLPSASITSYLPLSSRFRPGGSAPTLEKRLPSMTTASFCDAGSPVPSMSVPLRITSVLPLPLAIAIPPIPFAFITNSLRLCVSITYVSGRRAGRTSTERMDDVRRI